MERIDWNLLVLGAAGGDRLTPVQLQKALFLLSKQVAPETLGPSYYNFEPYNYGAFDANVYSDSRLLAHQGLASVTQGGGGFMEYSATPDGLRAAKVLEGQLPVRVSQYIHSLVEWVRGQSFASLVRAVYKAYPETKVNSVFKD